MVIFTVAFMIVFIAIERFYSIQNITLFRSRRSKYQDYTSNSAFITNTTTVLYLYKNLIDEGFIAVDSEAFLIVFAAYSDYRYQNLIRFVTGTKGNYNKEQKSVQCSFGIASETNKSRRNNGNESITIDFSLKSAAKYTTWGRYFWWYKML